MKSIWTASISFGLVNVPVKVYSAVEEHEIRARQIHAHDGGKITYKKVCASCNEAVDNTDIAKGYDTEDGMVMLTEDDLSSIVQDANREIEVLEFIAASEIDPLAYDRPYFVAPADVLGSGPKTRPSTASKAYALLTKVLADADRVAIVRYTMRSKTHLAALRVVGKGDTLAIQNLRWPDEIREPDFPAIKPVEISEAELKMAGQLIESMTSETFTPDKYRDDYQVELRELIEAKAVEGDVTGQEDAPADVSDLIAKLEKSVNGCKATANTHLARKRVRKVADKPVRRRAKVTA